MTQRYIIRIALGLAIILAGCRPISFKDEMTAILRDTSFMREVRKDGFIIRVNYLPMRYFELRHLMMNGDSTSDETRAIQEAHEAYGNGLYFMMTIGLEDQQQDVMNRNIANWGQWSEDLQKFYFRLGEYVYLKTESEPEIKLSVYDFQNTFGYTKDRKMLLCFPKEFNGEEILKSPEITMVIRDWGWDIGKQSVAWDSDDID